MLYEPDRHESRRRLAWDEGVVREAIAAIAADAESAFDAEQLWPIHPLDHTDLTPVTSYKSLYIGAAGVMWALHYLQAAGATQTTADWTAQMGRVHRAYLDAPETIVVMPAYLIGEGGILLVWWRMRPAGETADRLLDVIRSNAGHSSNELMVGTPGTMLAALFMHDWTGEERWRAAFLDGVERVWSTWCVQPSPQCWLWTQEFLGQSAVHVGAVHGAAGNLAVLLRGAHLLSTERRATLYVRAAEVLERTAVADEGGANWPQSVGQHREGRTVLLLQWCHGSPGVVGSMRHFPQQQGAQVESLLRRGGALTWEAGPLTKGPGLCHGTGGNGYTFLELYRRTGEVQWLERARGFAMHAIEQSRRMREQYGHGRYSLWTGDPGLAVYLWHCLVGAGGFPSVDVL